MKKGSTKFLLLIQVLLVFWGFGYAADSNVRHLILMIGDGMHLAHETAASRYLTGKDNGLSWHSFPYSVPVATWDVSTYNTYARIKNKPLFDPRSFDPVMGYNPSLGGSQPIFNQTSPDAEAYFFFLGNYSPATDSASAATALATGHKTDEGNLSWLPGDPVNGRLTTIAEAFRKDKGGAIGVVSTVPFSHATPAAFVSHSPDRDRYFKKEDTANGIADEIIQETKPEVVIGGGHPLFTQKEKYISLKLLYGLCRSGEYVLAERQCGQDGAEALKKAAARAAQEKKKLFGLFGGAAGNFDSPLPEDAPGSPQVKPATTENPLLKEAAGAALEVLSQNPRGFFLMIEQGDIDWANHENDFRGMIGCMWDFNEAVKAVIAFVDRPGDDIDWDNTLLVVTADHANGYMRLTEKKLGKGDLPGQLEEKKGFVYPGQEVTYRSTHHTNELVMLYARGQNAALEQFKKYQSAWYPGLSIIDNTQVCLAMMAAAGLPYPSPYTPTTH